MMQKHGEFFSRLGVSEDEVDDAMRNGSPTMAFNLGDLTIEGARAEGGVFAGNAQGDWLEGDD